MSVPYNPARAWTLTAPVSAAAACLSAAVVIGAAVATLGPMAAVGLMGLVALAWVALRAPGILFAVYLAIPLYKGYVQPFSPVDLTVLLALLNSGQIFFMLGHRRPHVRTAWLVSWLALTALIVVGAVYSPSGSEAVSIAGSWIALVFLPMLAAVRVSSNPRYVGQFVLTLLAFGLLFAVGGLVALQANPNARLVVLDTNTINVARAAMLVPIIAVGYADADQLAIRRAVAFIASPLALIAAIASGSRGPVLMGVMVLVPALCWALTRRGALRPRTAALGLTALASVLIVALVAQGLPATSLARFDSLAAFIGNPGGGGDSSALARQQLFDLAWQMFQTQPLLGWGTAAFATATGSITSLAGFTYPHDVPLEFAATYGILGLTVFGAVIYGAFRGGFPTEPNWRVLELVLVFWLLNALISGGLYEERMLWGLLLLMTLRPRPSSVPLQAPPAQGRTSTQDLGAHPLSPAHG